MPSRDLTGGALSVAPKDRSYRTWLRTHSLPMVATSAEIIPAMLTFPLLVAVITVRTHTRLAEELKEGRGGQDTQALKRSDLLLGIGKAPRTPKKGLRHSDLQGLSQEEARAKAGL